MGEVGELTPGQKYNKTDQLERIYMKKVKPMVGSLGGKMRGNRSQVKDEKEREKREDCIRSKAETYQPQSQHPLREFIRGKVSDSVDKISAWKYDPYRANTCEKGRTK